MEFKEIYGKDEHIDVESYLTKYGIKDVDEFINPSGKYLDDCYMYDNIRDGVMETKYALLNGWRIATVQDGDADGVLSTVELYTQLTQMREDADVTVLIHTGKQRGLDDEAIMDKILSEHYDLVIVSDAGSNNAEASEILCDNGIGLIVLDHHDINTPITKGTLISNQIGEVNHCGSGALVVHKFCQALDRECGTHIASRFIDLVALSLVSDSMDMSSLENRTYYHYGIETLSCVTNPFLKCLMNEFIGDKAYTQRDIAFKIVPKINSVCRHPNMEYKQQLFLAFIGATDLSDAVNMCNSAHAEQTATVDAIMKTHMDELLANDNHLVVLASDDIPRVYSGLVCGKVASLTARPSLVGSIKDGYFIGSMRSPIDFREDLANNPYVDFAQGHARSCGIGIYESNLQNVIDSYASVTLNLPHTEVLRSYSVNCIPKRQYGLFEPYTMLWGHMLPKPLYEIHDIRFNPKDVSVLGKNNRTLKITMDDCDIMIFNCTKDDKERLGLGYYDNDSFVCEPKDTTLYMQCFGTLSINRYKGKEKFQIVVDKYELSCYNKRTVEDIFG